MSIGGRIAGRRVEAKITQAELAVSVGVSTAFISQIESDLRKPSFKNLQSIAGSLNTTVEYIVSGTPTIKAGNITYAVELRLRFIDFLLHQYGTLNRSAGMDYFGISSPQASRDIHDYIALAPENIVYDTTAKTYIRGANFARVWP
jgi:transcriptional regulator with XRE-family HTH domain